MTFITIILELYRLINLTNPPYLIGDFSLINQGTEVTEDVMDISN